MDFVNRLVFLFAIFFLAKDARGDDFPASIERCKFEDLECIKNMWNRYVKISGSNASGLPELGIPNTHHFNIPSASISPGKGPVDIKLTMKDIDLTGFDSAVVDWLVGFPKDPKQMTKFELTAHAPFIRIVGQYNVTGKILLLPVAGADEGEVKFENVRVNMTAYTSTKMIDGKEYLQIPRVKCTYTTVRNFYRFENLLNNKEISDSINTVLNENQDILNNEIRPSIARILAGIFKKLLSDALTKYPYSSYFVE